MKRLAVLNVNDNYLDSFDVGNLPHLTHLYMDRNPLNTFIGYEVCADLECLSMESLSGDIMYCIFKDRNLQNVINNGHLYDLRLAGNSCMNISPFNLRNLDSLDLTGCKLTILPEFLSEAINLSFLSLENNELNNVEYLIHNKKLKTLQISRNRLRNIRSICRVISKLHNLQVLDLRYLENLPRENLFISSEVSGSQLDVLKIVLRVSLILSNSNLKFLNQETITSNDRKNARKRMDILRKYAVDYANRAKVTDGFHGWKPELFPLDDMTVEEDLILEVIN
jgi:Leucine-rich repeat (LRR) protein